MITNRAATLAAAIPRPASMQPNTSMRQNIPLCALSRLRLGYGAMSMRHRVSSVSLVELPHHDDRWSVSRRSADEIGSRIWFCPIAASGPRLERPSDSALRLAEREARYRDRRLIPIADELTHLVAELSVMRKSLILG